MNHIRGMGVGVTPPRVDSDAPEQTVNKMATMEMYWVEYTDEQKTKHQTVVYVIGGKSFLDQNAEAWLARLKPANKWFDEQVASKLAQRTAAPVAIPKQDSVDVIRGK